MVTGAIHWAEIVIVDLNLREKGISVHDIVTGSEWWPECGGDGPAETDVTYGRDVRTRN